jgi:hypothetical protein
MNATRMKQHMNASTQRQWFPTQRGTRWPPYHAIEQTIEDQARDNTDKLERLYHKGQNLSWDGRTVLNDLIAKHGQPTLPADKKDAALEILSILLWGELAAWAISADLALRIEDVEAKMAATSQAHDEARHFYVLRDYIRALGEPIPRLGGIARRLLIGILETDSLVHKLVGMQLLVESNALSLFKSVASAELDPVLTELMPYYERDEARHVGLGVMYLPKLLRKLSKVETAGVALFQLRCVSLLIAGGMPLRTTFRTLGLEPREMASHTVKLQAEILTQMRHSGGGQRGALGGLLNPERGMGPTILNFIHPVGGEASAPPVNRAILRAMDKGARWMDHALA